MSELRKVRLGKTDANLAAWAERVDAADLFVSAIILMRSAADVEPTEVTTFIP